MKEEIINGIGYDLVRLLREKLQQNGSIVTGNLRRSIRFETQGDTIVIKMSDYGKYVEYGTSPHVIKAKPGHALKFNKDGKDVIVKSVNHPGSRAKPFIRPVIHQQLKGIIMKNIKRYGNN